MVLNTANQETRPQAESDRGKEVAGVRTISPIERGIEEAEHKGECKGRSGFPRGK